MLPIPMVRELYAYHQWANRRLFTVAEKLGSDVQRQVGSQFSFPTLKGMFAHVYAADFVWLSRWRGDGSPSRLLDDRDFADVATLRRQWNDLEKEQIRFVEELKESDLDREIAYTSTLYPGRRLALPLWTLLQHVANHATHHRSEVATMITMISGSPPSTDLHLYHLETTGQLAPPDA